MRKKERIYRLQVHVTEEDREAIKEFWFRERLQTEAAAVRELIRRALARDKDENPD